MRRFGLIALAVVGALIGIFLLALIPITQTSLGIRLADRISRPIIEDALKESLGSDVSYAPLEGRLPHRLVVTDFRMSRDGAAWVSAQTLLVRWNPWSLLRGEIDVQEIVLAEAVISGPIPETSNEDDPEEEAGGRFDMAVNVDSLVLADITVAPPLIDQAVTVSLLGNGHYRERDLVIDLTGTTNAGEDDVSLIATLIDGELDLDVTLLSTESGVLASMSGANGPLDVRAIASGPLSDLRAELVGGLGQYGDVEGAITGSMETRDRVEGTFTYKPGAILPDDIAGLLGDTVAFEAVATVAPEQIAIEIGRLTGAFGTITGDVSASRGGPLEVSGELRGQTNADALAEFGAEAFAGSFELDVNLVDENEATSVNGRLQAGSAELRVEDGILGGEATFAGQVQVRAEGIQFGDDRLDLLAREGLSASASLLYTDDNRIVAEDLSASIGTAQGRRLLIDGELSAALDEEAIAGDINLRAGPQLLSLFLPDADLSGVLRATVNAEGSFDDLRLSVRSQIPGGRFADTRFAAGTLRADLDALPSAPSGSVNLSSDDNSYSLTAAVTTVGSRINISQLAGRAGSITLQGSGAVDRDDLAADLSFEVDAGQGAELITGQTISGQASASIMAAPDGGPLDINLTAEGLRFETYELGTLELSVAGPRDSASYSLTATDLGAGSFFVNRANSQGVLDVTDAPIININDLTVRLPGGEDNIVRLTAPTQLAFADGVTLSETNIQLRDEVTLQASASVTEARWQAKLNLTKSSSSVFPAAGQVSVSLDTEAAVPGTLALTLQAPQDDERYTLAVDGSWTGERVTASGQIMRGGNETIGTLSAQLPVLLAKSPRVQIEVPGDGLDAELQYDDRVTPLVSFLPIESLPLRGEVAADITVSGSLDAPSTEGSITLRNGAFEDDAVGITINAIAGDIDFSVTSDGTHADVRFTGQGLEEKPQSVKLDGTVDVTGDDSAVDVELVLDGAQLARSPELELRLSSDLRLSGELSELTLRGPINVDELDLIIPEIDAGDEVPTYAPVNIQRVDGKDIERVDEIEADAASPLVINLDLNVTARNGIFIRGRGLQSEWGTDLQITGTTNKPRIAGDVLLQKGELALAGRTFTITEGDIRFSGNEEINPTIDLAAEVETGTGSSTVTAIVSVEGDADDPEISFSSNPSRPEEDVLALVLFGRPASSLGASEALQLAQAAATLTGAGPFGGGGGVAASLRSGLGLDRLGFDPSSRALTVGKYISDDVYVSARQGIGEIGTVISVVYELSRFVSLETTLQPNGNQSLGANYKRDY